MTKVNFNRYTFYLLSRLASRGVPLVGVGYIYGVFEADYSTRRLTGMFTLATMFLMFLFYKDLKERIKRSFEQKWKDMVDEGRWFIIVIALLLFVQWAKTGLGNLEMLLIVIAFGQALSIYPAVLHRKYVRIIEQDKLQKLQKKATI